MTSTTGDTLTLLSAVAVYAEMQELLARFTRESAISVDVAYDLNPAVAKRVMQGEVFDVGLTNPWFVTEMISQGLIVPGSHTPFGTVPLAIGAVNSRAGGVATTEGEIRDLLMNSESVGYTAAGTSGKRFLDAIAMIGVRDALQSRLRPMGEGEPPIAAAKGELQYAIAPLSRIIAAPGVVPVATFPAELGLNIEMSMFVHAKAQAPEKASALVQFLSASDQDDYLSSHGIARFHLEA